MVYFLQRWSKKEFMKTLFTILSTILITSAFGQSPSGGSIFGRIVDSKTLEPLENVIVADTSFRPFAVAFSDDKGMYNLKDLPVGRRSLTFSLVGYKLVVVDTIKLSLGERMKFDLKMEQVDTFVEVNVVAKARRIENPFSSVYKLDIQEIEKAPGGNRDISKVVQNLPGVATTPNYRNDLIVRGGGPNENKFFLDRIEIPVLNHFQTQGSGGGNASLVNSDFLNSATLYTSAFPAAMSGSLSSVLDLRMIEGNSDRFKAKFAIGASDVAVTIDTPLGKRGNLIASYRRSYLQFLFAALKLPFLPTYNDAQFKFTYRFDDKNQLMILGLGSFDKSRLNLGLSDLDPSRREILNYLPENDQWSYVVGARYRHDFSEDSRLSVILSTSRLNNSLQKWIDNDDSKGKSLDYVSNEIEAKTRIEYDADLGKDWVIFAGGSFDRAFYDNNTYRLLYFGGKPVDNRYSSNLYLSRYGAYAGVDKKLFNNKFRFNLSLRIDGNNYSRHMSNPLRQFSPRLALGYDFAKRWSFNASLGRYYQEPTYATLGYRDSSGELANKDRLRYIQSDQFTAGFGFKPTEFSKVSIDGFYKRYNDYPMSLTDSTAIGSNGLDVFAIGAEPVSSVGKGRAYGVEVQYRNENLWGFRLYAAYTFYFSEFRKLDSNFEPTGKFIPSNWDNRHLVNILLSRELGKGWEIGARWRFSGGSPSTPYDVDLSSNIDNWNTSKRPVLDYQLYNTNRLPSFHQLDIRVDKQWTFKKWKLGLYIDIQNAYNYKAVGREILMPAVDGNGNYVPDPNKPGHYIMESYVNKLGGTIIPTFGIIIEI